MNRPLFRLSRDNAQLVTKLALIVALMFGFGYALVPLYRAICDALGINVLSLGDERRKAVELNTQVDRTRTITVEFDANARGPWDFKPAQSSIQVHPGELTTVMYEFRNKQDHT
ncbi:MAG: cytochrome c oxidase assembly protein, partial [Aquincola sp.]|nr:cytochrome c oxidase assembly protein [Aquincola sp.]